MKYRKDFVTNSSSSSYVCEICGRDEHGWDLCLSDADMVTCENGHTFCADESLDRPTREALIKGVLEDEYNHTAAEALEDMDSDDLFEEWLSVNDNRYELPEYLCPICSFVEYSQSDLKDYLQAQYGISDDEVFTEVKKANKRRKKLYDNEYITYVCQLHSLNPAEIVAGWKVSFGTYRKFREAVKHNLKGLQ